MVILFKIVSAIGKLSTNKFHELLNTFENILKLIKIYILKRTETPLKHSVIEHFEFMLRENGLLYLLAT